MNENTYWACFWTLMVTMILGVAWMIYHHIEVTNEQMIKAGYEYKFVPGQAEQQWVKESK